MTLLDLLDPEKKEAVVRKRVARRRPEAGAAEVPHVRGSATSREMAEKATPAAGTKKRQIYDWIAEAGPRGRTTYEVEDHFGWTHQSVSGSISTMANRDDPPVLWRTDRDRKNRFDNWVGVYVVDPLWSSGVSLVPGERRAPDA